MMKKMMAGIIIAAVIIAGVMGFCMWFLSGADAVYYYAQIDNSKIKKVNSGGGVIDPHGGMSYSYTLPAYDENGDEKDITFGTERELQEGSFIRLTVMPVRGVLEWGEVQYEQLPVAVQNHYMVP